MTPAVQSLRAAKIDFELLEYKHDPKSASYGLEAAERLDLDPGCVFKTLLAELDGRELVVALIPVADQLALKQLARALGGKRAEMAKPAQAERATGYLVGGISPFGQKKRHRTVLDQSSNEHPTIYVSGGRRGLEIGLARHDLIAILGATTTDIRQQKN